MIKRLVLILLGALAALTIVVLVRAALHRPDAGVAVAQVSVDVDEAAMARHLGEAVRFRTVSHQNAAEFEAVQFAGFVDWVERTYPEVGQAMQRELLGDYTMLYRWPGSDPALQPILLTAHYDVVPWFPERRTAGRTRRTRAKSPTASFGGAARSMTKAR